MPPITAVTFHPERMLPTDGAGGAQTQEQARWLRLRLRLRPGGRFGREGCHTVGGWWVRPEARLQGGQRAGEKAGGAVRS